MFSIFGSNPQDPRRWLKRLRNSVVVQNAAWLYVVQFTGYVIPLLTLPYLSRVLSVEKFGLVAFAQSIIWNFVTLTEYGFNLTATRAIAGSRDDPAAISRTFNAVMVAKTLLTLLGCLILAGMVTFVPRLRPHWALFAASFLSVIGYLLFPLWLFQGLQNMKHVAIRDFAAKLLGLAALFALVRDDSDYVMAAAAPAGGLLLAGIIGLATAPLVAPVRVFWPGWREVRAALITGWTPFVSSAASAATYSANLSLLALRGASAEIGYLNAASRLVAFPRSLIGPMSTAIFSHLSHSATRSEDAVIAFVRRYGWIMSAPFAAASVALLVTSPWVVSIILGEKYTPALLPLRILSVGPFLLALSHVYSTYYMLACGYDREWLRVLLKSIVVNFAVLIPLLFLVRGSVALAITAVCAELYTVIEYRGFYLRKAKERESAAVAPQAAATR